MNKAAFKSPEEILKELNVTIEGLSKGVVETNREKFGKNIIENKGRRTTFQIFLSQFDNFFNYILIAAAAIVFVLGDYVDFWVILSVIIINSLIGFIQEGKASKIFEVLQSNIKSEALVVRDGKKIKIVGEDVVVGDIISLKPGDKIPADARLLESNNLKMDEASLTGESTTVEKEACNLDQEDLEITEQKNMVFKGTHVVSGIALAVVVSVGSSTHIGKIAGKIQDINEDLPIKKTIKNLSKIIILIVTVLATITFFAGILYGEPTQEMFLVMVALFVSAIPESLPIILTVVLAAGFYRMGKNNVLVKRLQAVDALGQTNVVALDKTGTITKNQMTVKKLFVDGKMFDVSGGGYNPEGDVSLGGEKVDLYEQKNLQLLAKISSVTSIGDYSYNDEIKDWELNFGDPTEVSLLVFAKKLGIVKEEVIRKNPVIKEIPFDMEYKHHSIILDTKEGHVLYSAGAPEIILESSSRVLIEGEEVDMDGVRDKILFNIDLVTKEGFRVLAMAVKSNPGNIDPANMEDMTFVGFVAISDSIRDSVHSSLEALREAGMKAVMITGDYKETAIGIAKNVGIWRDGDQAITGKDMTLLSEEKLLEVLDDTTVFARVTPKQKLNIISLYKKKGKTIAMTGDGVNDVLSLVRADLGVSMGHGATDVAKEAADIILLDNNFGSIAGGVLEGRNIYRNIKKTTEYLLSTNIAELLVVMSSVLFGLPIALTAVQILWLNLVTDSFLAIGFAFEPLDKKLSKIKNWRPSKYLVGRKSLIRIFLLALVMTIASLTVFIGGLGKDLVYAQTMTLAVLTIFQFYNMFNIKAGDKSIFKVSMVNNKYLLGGIAVSAFMFVFAMQNEFLQNILGITPISSIDWIYVILVGLSIIIVDEVRKLFIKNG